jgi:pre-rRNA-processing protein TSR3
MDAPPLQASDGDKGIFLLDATWRYASKMLHFVESHATIEKRSIPKGFRTAYPRRQDDCPNPEEGLASIEALYIVYVITGRDPQGLLDGYHWKDLFLEKNQQLLRQQ